MPRRKMGRNMSTQSRSLALYVKSYFHTLNPLKIVAFLCLSFAAFVTIPDQTLEFYRYTAQTLAESYSPQGGGWVHFQDAEGLVGLFILVSSVLMLSLVFVALAIFLYALQSPHTVDHNES